MKTTSKYIAILRKYMAENAYKYGIIRMRIFGSVARGEQTESSDVDVCVEGRLHDFLTCLIMKNILVKNFFIKHCLFEKNAKAADDIHKRKASRQLPERFKSLKGSLADLTIHPWKDWKN